ncbi:MAG: toll/interleukin-1 receptor domain-containing protein [Candidatus Korobacteraceae bacterium]
MAFDVFVSYASKDKIVADAVCARLEAAGIRCWIAPRDIVAGTSYGEAIIEAIHGAKVMVLVFSSNANASGHIPKEVERAVSNGLAILPFRIEDVAPGKSLDYFIGSVHWLDAMTPPMEKHLDDLAATVHKLLPVMAEEQGAPAVRASGRSPQSAPGIPATAVPMAAVRSTATGQAASASSAKRIWVGVAAVVVLAAVVVGVILLRGGGSSKGGAGVPSATNPPGGRNGTIDSNPASKPGTPDSRTVPPPPSPAVIASVDPIVGCYQWFNNVPVVIRADGTMVGGPFTAHWRRVSTARHGYTFTWPEATDTVTISPDQQSLKGSNQYGFPTSGTRIAGSSGLVGTWRWPNGVPVTVSRDGKFSAASFHGRWRAIDASRGIYALTWPNPVDSVTLSADGSRVSGANQYGVPISGVAEPCAGN